MGRPAEGYPWNWSVYRWFDGVPASTVRIADLTEFAVALAHFLVCLQRIEPTGGPPPGPHNFFRGGPLETYGAETRNAIAAVQELINAELATEVWRPGGGDLAGCAGLGPWRCRCRQPTGQGWSLGCGDRLRELGRRRPRAT